MPHARHRRYRASTARVAARCHSAAAEVSRLIHEAHDLNLPVEPGVRDGRDALVRWAVLIEEVFQSRRTNDPTTMAPGFLPGGHYCGPTGGYGTTSIRRAYRFEFWRTMMLISIEQRP
jgi:hypothetical protein